MTNTFPRIRMGHTILSLLLGGVFLSNCAWAGVRLIEPEVANPYIQIKGEIADGDYESFIDAAREAHERNLSGPLHVTINSPGGNVREAMMIGSALRELRLHVSLPFMTMSKDDVCYSACLFIWVGAVDRSAAGRFIGIHRRRFDSAYFSGLTSDEAAQRYRKLMTVTKTYLHDMGARTDLIELMYQIPSGEIRVLDLAETEKYALSGAIASYDEWLTSKCGKMTDGESADWFKTQILERGSRLSEGYKNYLVQKDKRVSGCRSVAAWKDRVKAASQFFASH